MRLSFEAELTCNLQNKETWTASPERGERLVRITKGTLANILGQVLNVAIQLTQVPVLLAYWGTQSYGEWLALSAAVAYLATLDLGMQTYAVNRLTQCFAVQDAEEYTRVLHTGLLVNVLIPLMACVVIVPAIFLSPITSWLKLVETQKVTAAWVAALLSFQVVYSIGYGMVVGVYRTIGEYARGQMISNGRLLLNLLLTLGTVVVGGRFVAVAVVQLMVYFVMGAAAYLDLSRRRRDIQLGFTRADWRLACEFVAPSSAFLGIQIVNAMSVQGSLLLVNSLFGAAVLVVFTSLRTLSNLVRQAAATVQHALWPEFTALDAQENTAFLRTIHLLGAKLVMTIAVCSAVFLLTSGEDIVNLWTRGRVAYDPSLMRALLVLTCSQAHSFCSSTLMIACDRQKLALRYLSISSILGLLLGAILGRRFGAAGFVYGMTLSDVAICAIHLPWKTCAWIGESRRRFFVQTTLRTLGMFVVTYAAVQAGLALASLPRAAGLLASATLTAGVGLLAAYTLVLNGSERADLSAAVRRIAGS